MTQAGSRTSKKLQTSFTIDVTSSVDDVRYTGTFIAKKLTLRDLAALGVRKAQLNGGMHFANEHPGHGVDYETDELNGMIAHLELAIVDAPAWWKLDQMVDAEILMKVHKEVLDFENSFHRRAKLAEQKRANDARSAQGSERANSESNSTGDGGAVVSRDLSASLEP